MSYYKLQAIRRRQLDLTSASTLQHLLIVGVVCALLWTVIAATLGAN